MIQNWSYGQTAMEAQSPRVQKLCGKKWMHEEGVGVGREVLEQ